ncbi:MULTISPECIES: WXG100 family type VII secretion target [unclassified Nocardioides]|uniref:WXG100 family type VII secretion target n=1 Tax=unclassified Nocardioides TaxID=2615069 RepID=UPI0000570085|nr:MULTISPECIES: WXG100 family type VII secretion target [unclassified Nocardioides]ABL83229.1 hypothetical protein Noca_3729 [Nocardioides sp. JS614]
MDDPLAADHLAFRAAVAHVRGTVAQLAEDRDRVAARVDALLDRGWRGGAATSFAAGWAEWARAADAVRRGLELMGDLLEAADRDLVRADTDAGDELASLRARLG